LEAELGIKLFARTKRGIKTDSEGEELLNYAGKSWKAAIQWIQCARKLQYKKTGVLRLGYIGNGI
jgi:DNA-binding transcriptional LysR family regulator